MRKGSARQEATSPFRRDTHEEHERHLLSKDDAISKGSYVVVLLHSKALGEHDLYWDRIIIHGERLVENLRPAGTADVGLLRDFLSQTCVFRIPV